MISCAQAGLIGVPQGFPRYLTAAYAYADLAEPGGGWGTQAVPYGASPAVVAPDILAVSPASPGDLTTVAYADGTFSIEAEGDGSRKSVSADVYDWTLRAWYGAATFYVNDAIPELIDRDTPIVLFLALNVAMDAVDLAAYVQDADNDTLEVVAQSAWATGLSESGNTLSGTPTSRGIVDTTVRWTDIAGEYVEANVRQVIGQVDVPDTTGLTEAEIIEDFEAVYLTPIFDYAFHGSIAAGIAISQSIPAGTDVDPNTEVDVVMSLGQSPFGSATRPVVRVVRM